MGDLTFPKLLALYWESVHPKKSLTTQRREEEIKCLLEGHFGKQPLVQIRPQDVEVYQARRKAKVSAATVNREMVLLRHLFTKAVEWRYLLESPAKGIAKLREENHRLRYLTSEEAGKLLSASSGHLRDIVQVALNSGLRRGELLALKWADLDFERKVLTVVNSKSGKSRHIPMNRTLAETLVSIERMVGSPYVFRRADGKPFGSINTGFRTARERAGLKDVRFHDLRHTFASWLVIRGVSLAVVRDLLGHSSFEMTLRYAHLAPDQRTQAVGLLDGSEKVAEAQKAVEVGTPVAHRRKAI